jgi:thioredoxin reductase
LESTGWNSPDPETHPTGGELIDHYLEPLASKTVLREHIRTSATVIGVSRAGFGKMTTKGREDAPFEIRYRNGAGEKTLIADAVIDASGTWFQPNPSGANGLPAVGERELHTQIAYGMPDVLGRERSRYAGKHVAVLGSGHSAIGTLIDLTALAESNAGTIVTWLLRRNDLEKALGGGAGDRLRARGELGLRMADLLRQGRLTVETGFRVSHISRSDGRFRIAAGSADCGRAIIVDELVVATGFRPDLTWLSEIRIGLDPALECPPTLAPLIDPNEHSCGTVRPHGAHELAQPEARFYIAGMKSYGRAPTFLMLTGYEQVRSIAAELAGDSAAARQVELVLPKTGVCSAASTKTGARSGDTGPTRCSASGLPKADAKSGCNRS